VSKFSFCFLTVSKNEFKLKGHPRYSILKKSID
jgi:hypothetical protein